MQLPLHGGQIAERLRLRLQRLSVRWTDRLGGAIRVLQPVQGLAEAAGHHQRQRLHQRGFALVGLRQQQGPCPMSLGCQGEGHRSAYRSQFTPQAQLSSAPDPVQPCGIQLPAGCQHGQGDRQVEGGAFLAQIRRGQVHDHPSEGHAQMAVADGCPHALSRFLDGCIRQAHHLQPREPGRNIHLHGDSPGLKPHQGSSAASCQHRAH